MIGIFPHAFLINLLKAFDLIESSV